MRVAVPQLGLWLVAKINHDTQNVGPPLTKSLSWLLQKAPKTIDNYSLWMFLILVASYTLVFIGFFLFFFLVANVHITGSVQSCQNFRSWPLSRPRPNLGCTSWQGQGPAGPPNHRPLFEYRGGFPQKILFYLGVSTNGGESPNGWFIRENPI